MKRSGESARPRVVVAGMGDTGVLTAIRLARHAEVVGVSTKPDFVSGQELGLRLARPDDWARDYRIGFDRFRGLRGVRVVHGALTDLDPGRRTVAVARADGGREELAYDVLVVATGVRNGFWRQPAVEDAREVDDALAETHRRLAAARSVAVVGGGAAAVASAAQLAAASPDARVTLCFPGERALPHHHPRVWDRVRRRLERLGVDLRPGHRAELPDDADRLGEGPVRWTTGQEPLPADVVVWAVGRVRPNTGWLPDSLLDEEGFVRVEPDLRVPGAPGVFAIGDVAATDPLRTSARNAAHLLLARNVRAHLDGGTLKPYRAPRRRWGSVLGPLRDGLEVFAPNGRAFRIPRRVVDALLQPVVVRRGIYGGVRRRSRSA